MHDEACLWTEHWWVCWWVHPHHPKVSWYTIKKGQLLKIPHCPHDPQSEQAIDGNKMGKKTYDWSTLPRWGPESKGWTVKVQMISVDAKHRIPAPFLGNELSGRIAFLPATAFQKPNLPVASFPLVLKMGRWPMNWKFCSPIFQLKIVSFLPWLFLIDSFYVAFVGLVEIIVFLVWFRSMNAYLILELHSFIFKSYPFGFLRIILLSFSRCFITFSLIERE